eukprot:scaffold64_cov338-Pavlova_lutheri.AAC.65
MAKGQGRSRRGGRGDGRLEGLQRGAFRSGRTKGSSTDLLPHVEGLSMSMKTIWRWTRHFLTRFDPDRPLLSEGAIRSPGLRPSSNPPHRDAVPETTHGSSRRRLRLRFAVRSSARREARPRHVREETPSRPRVPRPFALGSDRCEPGTKPGSEGRRVRV